MKTPRHYLNALTLLWRTWRLVERRGKLITLNYVNGADQILLEHANQLLKEFPEEPLIGVEMGIAFGGGPESIGKLWVARGTVYGYDTFEDKHPDFLATDVDSPEARCMDSWYQSKRIDPSHLAYSYQRQHLDTAGLTNVILRKGLVTEHSCDDLSRIHYVFLDMDLYASMKSGYLAVRNRIVPGGYLFLHDCIPANHLPLINRWLEDEVLGVDRALWERVQDWPNSFLTLLRRSQNGTATPQCAKKNDFSSSSINTRR